MNDPLAHLPRLAQDYTPEQREACITYLASLTMEELRQRQAIKNWEIGRAYHNCPEEILVSVQEQAEQLSDAVRRKTFGGQNE